MKEIVDKKEKEKEKEQNSQDGGENLSLLSKIKWRESLKFFLSKENRKANYESLKHFAWMLCCQHILGTWSLFILC